MPRHHDPLRRAALRAAFAVSTLGTAGALTTACTVESQTDEMLVADTDDNGDASGDATSDTTAGDTGVADTGGQDTGQPPSDTAQPPSDTGQPPSDTSVGMDTGVPPSDTGPPPADTTVPPDVMVDSVDPGDMTEPGDAVADTSDVAPAMCGDEDGVCPADCDMCWDPDCCTKAGYTPYANSFGYCSDPSCFDEICCDEVGGEWTTNTSYSCDAPGCPVPGPFMPPTVRV